MALGSDGNLYLWGNGPLINYGLIPTRICSIPNKVTTLGIGDSHMSVVDEAGITWVWGLNKRGELGLGDSTVRQNPYPLLALKEKELTHVQIGHYFSIAYSVRTTHHQQRSKSEIDQFMESSQTNLREDSLFFKP